MARIAGINIPLNKRVEVGLTYIYGIGRSSSNDILAELGISPDTYVRDLTEDEVAKLRDRIDNDLTVEGDLRRERSQNVKRLMEIGCYRGLRHRRGLHRPRPEHQDQRPHAQGPQAHAGRRQEEGDEEVNASSEASRVLAVASRRRTSRWARPTSRRRSTTRSCR